MKVIQFFKSASGGLTMGILLAALAPLVDAGQSGPTFVAGDDPRPEGLAWARVESMSDEFSGDAVDRTKW